MLTIRNRLTVVLGIMTTVVAVALVAQTDVSGNWDVEFDTEQGASSATMTLQQDGEKLTGEMATDQGTLEFEGTITGDKVAWVWSRWMRGASSSRSRSKASSMVTR
jgi:hypothetical protein